MKTKIFLMIMIFQSLVFSAQEEDEINVGNESYIFTRPILIYKCKDLSCNKIIDTLTMREGVRFDLISKNVDTAIIKFWEFGKKEEYQKYNLIDPTRKVSNENSAYFMVLSKDFDNKTQRRYSTGFFPTNNRHLWFTGTSITAGVTVIPFKIRPNIKVNDKNMGFEFSKDVQLGISAGIKQRISNYRPYFVNVLYNIGFSGVTQDSYTTNGYVQDPVDVIALTHAIGLVLDYSKVQFGFFLGWDQVSDRNRNAWIYQGKPWYSIGLGYSIFSVSTKSNRSGEASKN